MPRALATEYPLRALDWRVRFFFSSARRASPPSRRSSAPHSPAARDAARWPASRFAKPPSASRFEKPPPPFHPPPPRANPYELQRQLVAAASAADSASGVQSSFSIRRGRMRQHPRRPRRGRCHRNAVASVILFSDGQDNSSGGGGFFHGPRSLLDAAEIRPRRSLMWRPALWTRQREPRFGGRWG
ncbi:hypothetical protein SETIT_3G307600v2 [Setaria italica]|uniref:Uncharacterized protein n=1 Tax=Setaria italica TaxID=4555 RepID=A0A368QL32_SETIT|nr:hypothetical protein SETIT_3G307600v2 [Setaria italica]